MKSYKIIKTDKEFDDNDIECCYNPMLFEGVIYLDAKTPVKDNPFVTFYDIKNTRERSWLETDNVIVLLKEEAKNVYTNENEGAVLRDGFVSALYECNNEKIGKVLNEMGKKIIKDNYDKIDSFTRKLLLKDNEMIISDHNDTYDIVVINAEIIEKDKNKHLQVKYDEKLINICDYTKEKLWKKEKLIYNNLISEQFKNKINKKKIKPYIKEFVRTIEIELGKITDIYIINENYLHSEISCDFADAKILIKTENNVVVLSKNIVD